MVQVLSLVIPNLPAPLCCTYCSVNICGAGAGGVIANLPALLRCTYCSVNIRGAGAVSGDC